MGQRNSTLPFSSRSTRDHQENIVFNGLEINFDTATELPKETPLTGGPPADTIPMFDSFASMHRVLFGKVINSDDPSPSSIHPTQENPTSPRRRPQGASPANHQRPQQMALQRADPTPFLPRGMHWQPIANRTPVVRAVAVRPRRRNEELVITPFPGNLVPFNNIREVLHEFLGEAGWEPWPINQQAQPIQELDLNAQPLAQELLQEDLAPPNNAGEILDPIAGAAGEEIIMDEAFIELNEFVPNVIEEELDLNVPIAEPEEHVPEAQPIVQALQAPFVAENLLVDEFPEDMLMGENDNSDEEAGQEPDDVPPEMVQLGFVKTANSFSVDPGLASFLKANSNHNYLQQNPTAVRLWAAHFNDTSRVSVQSCPSLDELVCSRFTQSQETDKKGKALMDDNTPPSTPSQRVSPARVSSLHSGNSKKPLVIVETDVRRSLRVKKAKKGFKTSACADKNCLACDSDPPVLSPSIIKNLGVTFCKIEEEKLSKGNLKRMKNKTKSVIGPQSKKSTQASQQTSADAGTSNPTGKKVKATATPGGAKPKRGKVVKKAQVPDEAKDPNKKH
ncbi:hypothetical protein C2845_PM07G17160 [Panicum miliaceum]|uniref:Uncharacterized protein n=1 Tax=Panicum miliaceum TaxID=4540 RepID=A0A3L6SNW2_PANMI|nr:hypothetical protein C2845_PM07G17160 [Panicum miliaceum]